MIRRHVSWLVSPAVRRQAVRIVHLRRQLAAERRVRADEVRVWRDRVHAQDARVRELEASLALSRAAAASYRRVADVAIGRIPPQDTPTVAMPADRGVEQ